MKVSESINMSEVSLNDPLTANLTGGRPEDDGPQWLWVLVRASNDPMQEVWVRYPAEGAPLGLDVLGASAPHEGDPGVTLGHPESAPRITGVNLGPNGTRLLSHLAEVAAERKATLHGIVRALKAGDHDALVQHARALTGV
jgi:hypothetical protein